MKPLRIPIIVLIIAVILIAVSFVNKTGATKVGRDLAGDGFAVLELFTSEGCSSCPPADELLGRIQQEAGNKPVYVLAYHVDYWDRNGWKDIFSNHAFTERQYNYSRRFADQVYTPQVIVNGKTEFVGSDAVAANAAIEKALSTPAARTLSIDASQKGDSMKISYQVGGKLNRIKLMIAVVQKHAVSKVKAGENGGRTLSHPQIVRDLHSFNIDPGSNGYVQISLPEGFNTMDWEIIGFLQDRETGVIYAAERDRDFSSIR